MNVILLKDVEKLGLRGEVVNVARGYARNFLLPRQLAEVATEGRVKEVKRIDAQKAMHEARSAEQAAEIAATLGKTVLRFDVKSGPTGSLFGSVTTTDIADEIWRTRKIRVDRRKIGIDTIKRIGRFTVPVDVFEGVTAELKLIGRARGRRVAARGGARRDGGRRGRCRRRSRAPPRARRRHAPPSADWETFDEERSGRGRPRSRCEAGCASTSTTWCRGLPSRAGGEADTRPPAHPRARDRVNPRRLRLRRLRRAGAAGGSTYPHSLWSVRQTSRSERRSAVDNPERVWGEAVRRGG